MGRTIILTGWVPGKSANSDVQGVIFEVGGLRLSSFGLDMHFGVQRLTVAELNRGYRSALCLLALQGR